MYIQKKLSEKEIYNNTHKKILVRVFENEDGSTKEIPIYSHCGSIYGTMALVLDSEKNIYYGKEYRDGTESIVYNFAIGKHEEEYSFEDNMLKELDEEFGAMSSSLKFLGESIVGNYDTGMIKYYIASNCTFGEQKLEPGEQIEIQKCTIPEFEEKITSGEINCPLTVTCYTLAKLKGFI